MERTKKSPKFWACLVLLSLVGQIAWVVENMYFNVFLYKMFRADASDIAAMVAASAIAATVTTVLAVTVLLRMAVQSPTHPNRVNDCNR